MDQNGCETPDKYKGIWKINSPKEVDRFNALIEKFEKIVSDSPITFPITKRKRVRRAVMSTQLSIVYRIVKRTIYFTNIFDNRSNTLTNY